MWATNIDADMRCENEMVVYAASVSSAGSLVNTLVKTLYPATISFHNFSDMSYFGELILQVINRGEYGTSTSNLSVSVTNDVSCTVVAVLDGKLHLLL